MRPIYTRTYQLPRARFRLLAVRNFAALVPNHRDAAVHGRVALMIIFAERIF